MSTIDEENGLDRESFGQLVAAQLTHISDIENILCEIAKDSTLESQTRGYAILILAAFVGYSVASFYQSILEHENDSLIVETLHWALELEIDQPEENTETERL
jgi:hypothetical protein